jgi:translation initiation factor 2D
VAYIDPDGDPLWFTIGKGSDDLIPTIYTLWRKEDLLPFLSTPAAVVPNLVGGADLMIPGGQLLSFSHTANFVTVFESIGS